MKAFTRMALPVLLACAGCTHVVPAQSVIPGLEKATHVYTLTNLHPDEGSARLYSANFQQPGLIPICTEVTLLEFHGDWMNFRVNSTGKAYEYVEHDAGGEPLPKNLARYFGTTCPKTELDALTPKERDAVRAGVVVEGMRKKAVILALGYPPLRDTPSLDGPRWRYWHSRWNSFVVAFDADDKVSLIGE